MDSSKPDNLRMEWEPGQLLLGDFEVQRVLGQGGMGKVYLVRSRMTGMEFALKHALIKDDNNRQNFLSELQTWINLPEHPHIAACRFFRTIGDEIAIFAEYVSGGTLADWIPNRRLTTLEEILDVAIQFAWGLQALHDHGLIHQDVKPGNVLMTLDGIAKVTDFGLARARLRSEDGPLYSPHTASGTESVLVSFGGMTQAYCSPEQAAKQPLSRKTDIWSWGVSVLDMFYGQPSCLYGQTAGQSLEAYFEEATLDKKLPRMPVEMTMVLGRCFQPKPEHRWKSVSEAADVLVQLYNKVSERSYSRQVPAISSPTSPTVPAYDRRTATNTKWHDPRTWLELALRAEGRDPAKAAEIMARDASSHRGQLAADVATYDEARRIFERLIKIGRKDFENDLAMLCHNAASVHSTAGDSSGALAMYDRAIEIRERLVNVEGRRDLADSLASLYMDKAVTMRRLGDNGAVMGLYDRAIEILEQLTNVEGRCELANDLAMLYMNKANASMGLGDNQAAVDLYDRSIEIRERLVNVEGRHELASDLALACMNKASAVRNLGDNQAAADLNGRAIKILERLVNVEGRGELANDLAYVYVNNARVVTALGDERAAERLHDRATEILDRLVNVEGRRELADDLARLYHNKAGLVGALGDNRTAVGLYDRAIEIFDRLVNVNGRSELLGDLAWVKADRGLALIQLGDTKAGKRETREAMAVLRKEVNRTNRADLRASLDWITKRWTNN